MVTVEFYLCKKGAYISYRLLTVRSLTEGLLKDELKDNR